MIETLTPRILVLDDEAFMLRLMIHTLANLGFSNVTGCDSGRTALKHVDDLGSPPNIILCDLHMPEMNGVEFVRALVDHSYVGSLILFSGDSEQMLQTVEKLARAHRITMLGHLRKPVLPATLAALLEKWPPA
jgi:CheY-like chemotaxis protein